MSSRATLIWIRDPVKLRSTISSTPTGSVPRSCVRSVGYSETAETITLCNELCDASARIESRVCLTSVAGKRLSRQVHVINPYSSPSLHHQVQPNQIRLLSRLEEKRSHGRHPTHGARNWTIQPT